MPAVRCSSLGGPGTGKTRALVARFAVARRERRRAPETILARRAPAAAADALRAQSRTR